MQIMYVLYQSGIIHKYMKVSTKNGFTKASGKMETSL